jgi:hypothetical protein
MSLRPKPTPPKTTNLSMRDFHGLVQANQPSANMTDVQMITALENRGWVVKKPTER